MLTFPTTCAGRSEALPEDDRKNADAGVAALIEGVEMIERVCSPSFETGLRPSSG
jgi:molecular chaperone GrpE